MLNGRRGVIDLIVIGSTGRRHRVRAMIDTGFDGWLTLPTKLIRMLELHWYSQGCAELADGSESFFKIYRAAVLWDRARREVFISETNSMPMVGMALMKGYVLNMQIRAGGKVMLSRMP